MGYKSRANWLVDVGFCCVCGKRLPAEWVGKQCHKCKIKGKKYAKKNITKRACLASS